MYTHCILQLCIDNIRYRYVHMSVWKTLLLTRRVMDFAPFQGDSPLSTDTPHRDLRRSTPVVKLLKLDLLPVKGSLITSINMAID